VSEHLPAANREDGFWLSRGVMSFLTENPQGLSTEAIVLEDSRNHNRVLLTAQTFTFTPLGQVRTEAGGETSRWNLRRRFLAPFSFRVLCLGQFLTSGDFASEGLHGLAAGTAEKLLPAVAEALMRCHPGCAAYLIKDLYPTEHSVTRALRDNHHYLLPTDPVMYLKIRKEWLGTEDYLAALTSKYRVRYRRARGKLGKISRQRLGPEEVAVRRDRIYQLYRSISAGADFNATTLTPTYFPWLAKFSRPAVSPNKIFDTSGKSADEQMTNPAAPRFYGYFDEDDALIGFATSIPNGTVLHAHFLGFDESYNRSHHLYHNMLFDLLEDAVAGGFHLLDYGRTALEIKSSVGARATDYAVLVKARYGWLNYLISVFTPAVYSAPEWTVRNPIK